jgi:hypothetical protein
VSIYRFRMSSIEHADQLVQLMDALGGLELNEGLRASRPLGYAYHRRCVDIESPSETLPKAIVAALDPLARLESVVNPG